MTAKFYLTLAVMMEERAEKEALSKSEGIGKGNQGKNVNLENVEEKKKENQERKRKKIETPKSFHKNRSKKLFPNDLFRRLMKVMTKG